MALLRTIRLPSLLLLNGLLVGRSGDSGNLARGVSNTLEKGLSGTYAVPSSATIAEKVQQLSLR